MRRGDSATVLAATLLCELGRAEDPRYPGGQSTDIIEWMRTHLTETAFKAPQPRVLTLAEARRIVDNYQRVKA